MSSEAPTLNVFIAGEQSGWVGPSRANVPMADENVSVSRFVNDDLAVRELQLDTGADHYRVSVTLRGSKVLAHYNGRHVYDGKTTAGMVHIAEPGTKLSAVIRSPGEALHFFVPTRVLAELGEGFHRPTLELRKTVFQIDSSLGFLAQTIAHNLSGRDGWNRLYVDSLCTAAVARLIGGFSNNESATSVPAGGLSAWRLKKVRDYIDAHLQKHISLKDLAAVAGLSQMHFAAQFRRACGVRPHEYLVRQRIEQGKDLLGRTTKPVVEIALAVGFETHSHFTNTFKRFVGASPAAWRRLQNPR